MRAVGTSNNTSPERSAPETSAETQAGSAVGSAYRLMILSDIRFLREGLAEFLARDGAFAVVGFAGDLDQALALSRSARPQVIVIDAVLPNGLATARSLGRAGLGVPLVAIALAETETDVIAWAEAGISGYVPRTAGLGDLVQCLSAIVRGEKLSVLLTERTAHLNDHAGQVSFPGGRSEREDASPIETASRCSGAM